MAKTPYNRDVSIGPRLRFARMNAGFTQQELAARAGITSQNYSKYERGETFPQPKVLVRLCEVLDVSSDFLYGISDSMESPEPAGGDYICMMGADGSRHMYSIPEDIRDRVSAVLKAGFPEIMNDDL